MDTLAIIVVILHTIISATTFHFQRFTLGIARKLVWAESGSRNPGDIPKIQLLITPVWMGAFGWLATILLILGALLVAYAYSWLWAIALIAWHYLGLAMLDVVWPLPSRGQCAALVRREVMVGMANAAMSGDKDRLMVCGLVLTEIGEVTPLEQ